MRLWAMTPIVALAALIVVSAILLLRGGTHPTLTEGRIGRPAPTFALSDLNARDLVTSDDFAGKPHLINVFASWCTGCRAEADVLMALKQQGVLMLGVDYKDKPDDALGYLRETGNPYTRIAQDPDGRYALQLGTAGAPETFVVGADGRIRAVIREPLTEETVRTDILPALGR
ncbi:MAG: DsbE family thiol:disulfide interchange protein [Alphaproteobacteria bacterium]